MKLKISILVVIVLFPVFTVCAQYSFSGYVNETDANTTAYLSVVDDYRKISGVYEEQIIAKVAIDSNYFQFKGNNLDLKNRIYRIHIDSCNDNLKDNHFNGKCPTSKEIIFIANNKDTIVFPTSFEEQVFCSIESNNTASNALFRIDSLKEQMRYDYGSYRSEANRRLNNKKWFSTLQNFGERLDEPLAELYSYQFLSNRSGDFYEYYLNDVKTNTYYDALLDRLDSKYPNSSYSEKYRSELASDKFIGSNKEDTLTTESLFSKWTYVVLGLSLLLNILLFFRLKKAKRKKYQDLNEQLTAQEKKVLELILQNKTNKEIAQEIFISVSTVKTHINNLYKKLNVDSREQVKLLYDR